MPIDFAPPQSANLQGFQITPAQYTDPLETLSKMGQIKTQNLQQQEAQLGIQQKQMDVQSEQGFMKAYLQSNGDIDQAVKLAPQYGVLPKDIFAAQQLGLKAAQDRATLDKTKMEEHDMWRDQVHAAYQPMFGEKDPNKQASLAASIGQDLVTKGLVTPGKVFQYTDPRSAQLYEAGLNTDKWITNQAAQISAQARTQTADTAAQKFNLEKLGLTSDNEQKQRASTSSLLASATNPADYDAIRDKYISGGGQTTTFPASRQVFDQSSQWVPGMQALINRTGMTPEQRQQAMFTQVPKTEGELVQASTDPNRTPADRQAASAALEQLQQLPKTEAELSLLAVDPKASPESRAKANAALKRLDQSKLAASPQFNLTIPGLGSGGGAPAPNLTGEDYLGTLPPATSAQVKAIAEGRDNMPPASSRSLSAIALRNAVYKYDPTFNEQRAQIRKAFTTGPDGTNIGNLNTGAVHAEQFLDAATALKNSNFQPGNAAYNALRTMFGSSTPTNLEAIKNVWAGEMANALKGNATDPEIASIKAGIDKAGSPDQFAGVVQEDLKALGSKLQTYHQRAQAQGVGNWSPVLPSALRVFQKHGLDPTAAPGGGSGGGLPQGGGKAATADVIKQYLGANGNDKVKARKALTDAGWIIPKAQ
jgi:hypothetical protein